MSFTMSPISWLVFAAVAGHRVTCLSGAAPIVTVDSGRLRGVEMTGKGHTKNYFAFNGIPYAEPPVGELRFRAPRTPKRWDGIRIADKEGSDCAQMKDGQMIGSEDCLYLNVFTPTLECPSGGLAVMVYIHAGAFYSKSGSSKPHGPDFLVNEGVVLVNINYRLSAFGFLNFNTETIPGNAGLKDMIAALKWVQQNIHAFCGDAARVTVFGLSAGAKAISILSASTHSLGLFRATIQMSGNAMGLMAYTEDNVVRCRQLAARLGGKLDDDVSVVSILKTARAEDILYHCFDMIDNKNGDDMPYNPYVFSPELRPADSEPVLLDSDPEFGLSNPPIARVPTLAGDVSCEGLSFAQAILDSTEKMEEMRAKFTEYIKQEVLRMDTATATMYGVDKMPSVSLTETIAQAVRDEYFDGNEISPDSPQEAANFIGHVRYTFPLYFFASRVDKQATPLYLYLFDVDSKYNANKKVANSSLIGAAHGDDLYYLFRAAALGDTQDLEDQSSAGRALRRHVRLFTDFAKNLSSPLLPPDATLSREQPPYLYMGDTLEVRTENTLGAERRLRFWRSIADSLRHPNSAAPGSLWRANLIAASAIAGAIILLFALMRKFY